MIRLHSPQDTLAQLDLEACVPDNDIHLDVYEIRIYFNLVPMKRKKERIRFIY